LKTSREYDRDVIRIEQLKVLAHIGVPDDERASAQKLTFNLALFPARSLDDLNDEIGRTVNYAAVCDAVKKFVGQRNDKLIETLADALASHLLATFEIRRITVELRKYILPDVEFVSVSVTRERAKK
jgi:dihydroneopterin aldolase